MRQISVELCHLMFSLFDLASNAAMSTPSTGPSP